MQLQPKRLVFEPDHDPVPRTEDGGIDWSRVTRVCIVAGRLQYEGVIPMNWMNGLKESFCQIAPETVTADLVQDRLEALEIMEEDIADAVAWARQDP